MAKLRDPDVRRTVTDNAYRDLIASGRYSYGGFVKSFDDELAAAGLEPGEDERVAASVTSGLERDRHRREAAIRLRARPSAASSPAASLAIRVDQAGAQQA